MHVIPTDIPMAEFPPGGGDAFRGRHGIGARRPMLLYVGRVAYEKNIGFLLRALERAIAQIPDLLLTIAGEGPALASLKKLVARLNLQEHVLFVGYLDRRGALLDCYRAADAFVFASRTGTQGLVLLEAMALGIRSFPPPSWVRATLSEPGAVHGSRKTTKRISPAKS